MTENKRHCIAKNYLHVFWRIPALIVWILSLISLFTVMRLLRISGYARLPHTFHQGVCFILGLKVESSGELHTEKPTLYVSNHISYLDIFVLGYIPAYFVAKSEVATWPVLGYLSGYQNTLFIERKSRSAKKTIKLLTEHLQEAQSLIIFPEGTSTDGAHVKPFKSSLFQAAVIEGNKKPIPIQPITVTYTRQNGQKMDQVMRDYYAWYGTMPFLSHFFALFLLKKVDVKVHFHSVCYLERFTQRLLDFRTSAKDWSDFSPS